MDSNQQPNKSKIMESINKNKVLIEEKKYYEFAQKIKLLAHRKMQMKKLQQAQILLINGSEEIFKISQIEQEIGMELIQLLVEIYIEKPDLLTPESQTSLLKATTSMRKPSRKLCELFFQLIKKVGTAVKLPKIVNVVVDFHISIKRFSRIESIVATLNIEKIVEYLEAWCSEEQTTEEEIPAIWCRMILMRGIAVGITEARELYEKQFEMFGENPYFKYTLFLLKIASIKSKQAFFALEESYSVFLNSDVLFKSLTEVYGEYFLNIKRKGKGGLEGLFS